MENISLTDCPLCGEAPHAAYHNEFPAITCTECDLVLISRAGETFAKVAFRWNTRHHKLPKRLANVETSDWDLPWSPR